MEAIIRSSSGESFIRGVSSHLPFVKGRVDDEVLELGLERLLDAHVLVDLDAVEAQRHHRRRERQRAHAVAAQPAAAERARLAQLGGARRVHLHLRLESKVGVGDLGLDDVEVGVVLLVRLWRGGEGRRGGGRRSGGVHGEGRRRTAWEGRARSFGRGRAWKLRAWKGVEGRRRSLGGRGGASKLRLTSAASSSDASDISSEM